jgi:HEAT repeat protein
VRAMGRIRDADGSRAAALSLALRHPDARLRATAVDVLGELPEPAAQQALQRAARDADPEVAEAAIDALAW